MEIDKKLYQEIKDYCKLNNLKVGEFINSLLRKAFNIEKYGEIPLFMEKKKEPLIKVVDEESEKIDEIEEIRAENVNNNVNVQINNKVKKRILN